MSDEIKIGLVTEHTICQQDIPPSDDHEWQPVSMVFETQLLDDHGRVLIRQPDIDKGRVYLVCLKCAQHTYMTTSWANYRLYGSEDRTKEEL